MLVGMRVMRGGDTDAVDFEYKVEGGRAVLTIGDPLKAMQSVDLSEADNAAINVLGKKYGVRLPPFAAEARKTYTPADGVNFVLALLVRFDRSNGYSWGEPILS